jgi:thioredoxin 1
MARTVVLLTASWCPRCPVARRVWEQLRDRFRLNYRELDIDTPEGQEILEQYAIPAVPAVILDGRVWCEVVDEAEALRMLEARDDEPQQTAFA